MSSLRRPNILWISFEDTHPFYGCYGDPFRVTPNVDRLAAEGCRWPLAFSTAGVCAPARSAIITGMYPTAIGTHHMRTAHRNRHTPEMPTPYSAVLPAHVKCFSEYLRAAGYYCTNNVKTDYQFDPPFTAWDELSTTAHWRHRPDPDQPFFAVFNPTRTHESGMWHETYDGEAKPRDFVFDPDAITPPPYFPNTRTVRESIARMYTNLARSDHELGELLQQLADDGLADNTIVFHWSDHGPMPRGKRFPYDAGIRVPFIVRWPGGLEPGSVSDELVSTVDLGPTVLSLAGIEIPRHMQGQPLLGDQKAYSPREYIYASRDRHDESYDRVRAVRDQRYKYLWNAYTDLPRVAWVPYLHRHPIMQELWQGHLDDTLDEAQSWFFQTRRPPEELYDTVEDPHELNNLATHPAHTETLDRMRAALRAWQDEVGDMGAIPEQEMVRRWYPDGKQPVTAAPVIIPMHRGDVSQAPCDAGTFAGPVRLVLHCPTEGASLGYTFDEGDEASWQLYTGPIDLPEGHHTIRTKAIRIGYAESDERVGAYTVTEPTRSVPA